MKAFFWNLYYRIRFLLTGRKALRAGTITYHTVDDLKRAHGFGNEAETIAMMTKAIREEVDRFVLEKNYVHGRL